MAARIRFGTVNCKTTGGFAAFAFVIAARIATVVQNVIITAGSKMAKSIQLAMATAQMAQKSAAAATEPNDFGMDKAVVAFSAFHRKE